MSDATDAIWMRNEIESPCVKICVVHPESGLCIGCYRSRDEIGRWSIMSATERQKIMAGLAERAPLLRGVAGRRPSDRRRRGGWQE